MAGGRAGHDDAVDPSTSSSSIATPQNGQDSYSTSETGSPLGSLPARELPEELIDFMRDDSQKTSEPPRKRQKVDIRVEVPGYDHVVVKKSTWEIEFAGSKLSQFETPMEKRNILPYVQWTRNWGPEYVEIMDEKRGCLFHAPLPPNGLEDVHLALLVDHESKKWARLEGRLWTEFGLVLLQKNGLDLLQMTFTIKWNMTSSPYHVMQATAQTQALSEVLNRYFPDPNVTKAEKWSPQDFYQSVHSPDKNDEVSLSMKVDDLETDLYPFQKRAVQWLLRKEGVEWSGEEGVKSVTEAEDPGMPISFIQATDDVGRTCYISHLFVGIGELIISYFWLSHIISALSQTCLALILEQS